MIMGGVTWGLMALNIMRRQMLIELPAKGLTLEAHILMGLIVLLAELLL